MRIAFGGKFFDIVVQIDCYFHIKLFFHLREPTRVL